MAVTFHRAFDMCQNPMVALEQLTELGVARILTSGQQQSAELACRCCVICVRPARAR